MNASELARRQEAIANAKELFEALKDELLGAFVELEALKDKARRQLELIFLRLPNDQKHACDLVILINDMLADKVGGKWDR